VTAFACESDRRRVIVGDHGSAFNGIDYLEVVTGDQLTLAVHFLHPLPGQAGGVPGGPPLTAGNVSIEGGERVRGVRVISVAAAAEVLTVVVDRAGDFSAYTLSIVASPTDPAPPDHFDPVLSAVGFSFKVSCPTDFDCVTADSCPPPPYAEPDLSYLAKDYASFVELIEGRLSLAMPQWRERNPADVVVTLAELLAHAGDLLSYQQDAVAAEAYLQTARSRVSARRHARLLDYRVHDGCNARTWVVLDVTAGSASDGALLPAGARLLPRGLSTDPTVPTAQADALAPHAAVVFETMHDARLLAARSRIAFHTWGDEECCLPAGSTTATLVNTPDPALAVGDVLVLEETVSPVTGLRQDADRTRRQAVRLVSVSPGSDPVLGVEIVEVRWADGDALRFPLCVSARIGAGDAVIATAAARGNVVLADMGFTAAASLEPPAPPLAGRYRPLLVPQSAAIAGVTSRAPYDDSVARSLPAVQALRQDPRACLPSVALDDGSGTWLPLPDLIGAPRFAAVFVVETETDGRARLRFGGGSAGQAPAPGVVLAPSCRVGNGPAGNIGPGALATLGWDLAGVTSVSNPMAAEGGTAPETMARVRTDAPQAFRRQERAVTEADYIEVVQRHPEVQRAAARISWTGSWYTAYVTVDRRGGRTFADDPSFAAGMRAYLDGYRLAGYDVELADPSFVPLDIAMSVCVRPGYFRVTVKEQLLLVLSAGLLPDGRPGFFHPDQWSFGESLYASALYATALGVAGVDSVELATFQRYGKAPAGELGAGLIAIAPLEVLRLDNDPSAPEHGRLVIETEGGL
jgi:hypothetical protein